MNAKAILERINAATDLPRLPVKVPEWGIEAYLATLTGTERDRWQEYLATLPEKAPASGFFAKLVSMTLCDAEGTLVCPDPEVLMRRDPRVIGRLFDLASKHNGLDPKAVEDEAGKSAGADGGSSSTGSPST